MSADEVLRLPTKIEPSLLRRLAAGAPGDQHRFLVELAEQADLVTLRPEPTRQERQTQVVAQLQATARQAQAELLTFLEAQQAKDQVQEIRPFWIFNGVAVTADAETLLALAARPEVRLIREDHWRRWIHPFIPEEGLFTAYASEPQWNISRIRADLAWSALRLDGSGVTVAIIDAGVDWHHPALQAQYRGYKPGGLAIHQGNWFSTTDDSPLYPVDANGHGTHVTGTAVGSHDAAGQAIGVAPGARWIAVKAFNDQGYAYDSWIHAAFEWIMAPAGDPGLAPDIVNGSWGSRLGQDEVFRPDLQVLRAAGIVPVFAAGNEGPRPASVRSPASYPEAIAVGATDDIDQVTSFSSRGPSPWGEVKPEVVAPGTQIRSSLPGGTYGPNGGSSMAVPHVVGVVALMLQADPTLSVQEVEAILTSSAQALSGEVPNNDSGWGRIDAYRAASTALKAGTVTGRITRQPDSQPLPTARISFVDDLGEPWAAVQADEAGHYSAALPAGRYSLTAEAFGYAPQTVPGVTVQAASNTTVDLILSPLPSGVLWGQVTNAETGGAVGADISIVGQPAHTTSDPQTGQYSIVLPAGTYTLEVSQNGYRRQRVPDTAIVADQASRSDVALTPAPTLLLVDSGRWYYGSQASYFEQALDDRDYVYDLWEIRDWGAGVPSLEDLTPYEITIWSSPQDAPGLIGAGDTISNYLTTGGNLLLTGQDVGFWDDGLSGLYWHPYYEQLLKAEAVADDAGRLDVVGLPDDILAGLSLSINGPDSAVNQASPDVIAVRDPRDTAILGHYENEGGAALRASGCQSYRAVYLAAGLEGLGDRASRAEVMDRSLAWLGGPRPAVDVRLDPPHQDQVWLEARSITYTVELQNRGKSTDRFGLELSPSGWPAAIWDGAFSQVIAQSAPLAPCQTQTLGLKVSVPTDVVWNITDVVTLTARSLADPGRTAQATFSSKAPAPILLVDDHRWYDTSGRYEAALDANHLPYDLWTTRQPPYSDIGPTLEHLSSYPLAIWFTGYDWYKTLTPEDEARLAAYLDGGGRLLLTSQDYLYTSGFTDFARDYLGVASYTEGLTATQVTAAVGSPIGHGLDPYKLVYPFRNWSDALHAAPAAQIAFWGQHAQPVALTLEQMPRTDDVRWKTAFSAFPLEALDASSMATVLGDTVEWLSPLGDSSFTVDRPVAAQGDQLAYTLLVRNTGPRLLSRASFSNTVPLSTTYVPGSLEGPADYDPIADRFTWSGSLVPNEAITIAYRLQLDPLLVDGMSVQNAAHLRDESGLGLDRIASSRINTAHLASSAKLVSTQLGTPGQVLTYTMILHNDGLRLAEGRLSDPIPLHTAYRSGSGWASSGLLTSTAEALLWMGAIPPGQAVTVTFPVVISLSVAGRYVHNRAILDDGWSDLRPIEAYTWVEVRLFLPLILKQP